MHHSVQLYEVVPDAGPEGMTSVPVLLLLQEQSIEDKQFPQEKKNTAESSSKPKDNTHV